MTVEAVFMYAQLLDVVLQERRRPGTSAARGERLAELLRCRGQLAANAPSNVGPNRVAVTLADQLEYDIALVEFAQGVGVDFDLRRFDQPEVERDRLEQALVLHGIPLHHLDEQAPPTTQSR